MKIMGCGLKEDYMKKAVMAALLVFIGGSLFAADRYALVIGNGNYRDKNISSLSNPVNDATDVAAVLKRIGYNVTLKTNVGLRDMIGIVKDFSGNLKRSSDTEGLFWFAGHGLSVRGIHYLLPVDVDPVDDNMIVRGSFSVDDLMEEIGNARNRTNLIVIDACRNTLLPGGERSVGSRGLTVLSADDYRVSGNKIVYSTMAGRTASDGAQGSRNSPFAQAFIANIEKPEIFDDVFLDIANETMRLTRGDQQPYAMGSFAVKSYAINPPQVAAASVSPMAPAATTPVSPLPAESSPEKIKPEKPAREPVDKTDFTLDGSRLMALGAAPGMSFRNPYFAGNLTWTFFEKYGEFRKGFLLPNSFFLSAETIGYSGTVKSSKHNWEIDGREAFSGGIIELGALYKIRLDQNQRFILNFGVSFALFALLNDTDIDYRTSDYEYKNYKDDKVSAEPGVGIHTGLAFRFTPLVSMDLGFAFKGTFAYRDKFEVPTNFGDTYYIGSDSDPGIFLIGSLGVTFWFPR